MTLAEMKRYNSALMSSGVGLISLELMLHLASQPKLCARQRDVRTALGVTTKSLPETLLPPLHRAGWVIAESYPQNPVYKQLRLTRAGADFLAALATGLPQGKDATLKSFIGNQP